jgi:GAF domain-containing protein
MTKLKEIADFGKKLMGLENMDNILDHIASKAKELVNADRCSIFIVDNEDHMLWTKHSDGIGRIVIGLDSGIVGEAYEKREPQVVNNPYEDARFLPNIDKKSGYKTKNIIAIPIYDSKQEVMGVMQLLNRSRGDFNESDVKTLTFFANYVSGSLELVLLQDS